MYLQRLTTLTNVVIVISKSDDQSPEEIELVRRSLSEQIRVSDIRQFQFPSADARQPPFTVCSTPAEDDDNMDASLLMSSEYVQPLVPSELGILIQQMFDNETASCLRHLAATKLVQAQRRLSALNNTTSLSRAFSNPLSTSPGTPTSLQSMVPQAGPGLTPYMQARIADHTQQEERLAQIRLAKWAAGLQRSLENERQRYEALARGERANWLSQKLSEISKDEVSDKPGVAKLDGRYHHRQRSGMAYQYGLISTDDPLGLLRWNEFMAQKGWIVLQVAGGFGVLGAVAIWVAKAWSFGDGEWNCSWWRGP